MNTVTVPQGHISKYNTIPFLFLLTWSIIVNNQHFLWFKSTKSIVSYMSDSLTDATRQGQDWENFNLNPCNQIIQ